MRNPSIRQKFLPLRFILLSICLTSVTILALYTNNASKSTEKEVRLLDGQLLITVDNCSCTDCFEPEEYPFTCCRSNRSTCVTNIQEVCQITELCVADLLPGGSGAAHCMQLWELGGGIALYICILLYLFLGSALVIDSYFIPCLEKISISLELSDDVAGATFMAAGSSAPELFISLADNVIANTPKNVGLGTVVGSAVYNTLVIVGLSAILAGRPLFLDWHPLARDSIFSVVTISLLLIVVQDGYVTWYEGLILAATYSVYVVFMVYNQKFFDWADQIIGISPTADKTDKENANKNSTIQENGTSSLSSLDLKETSQDELALEFGRGIHILDDRDTSVPRFSHTIATSRPSFAVSAANEIRFQKRAWSDPNLLKPTSTPQKVQESHWNPLKSSRNRADWKSFTKIGRDSFGYGQRIQGISKLDPSINNRTVFGGSHDGLENFAESRNLNLSAGEKTSDESKLEVHEETYWQALCWPVISANELSSCCSKKGCLSACSDWSELWQSRLWYILVLPLNVLFRLTIPDCTYDVFCEDKLGVRENRKIGFSVTFSMCIVWIAILAQFLVFFAAKLGCLVGLSPSVMGLTILAAGTSIPDTLASVIVAKKGQGDMAVANALGSNVFNIFVGLGLPWFVSGLIYDRPAFIEIGSIWIVTGYLFAVLFILLLVVLINKWSVSRRIGYVLVATYMFYVLFELFIRPK